MLSVAITHMWGKLRALSEGATIAAPDRMSGCCPTMHLHRCTAVVLAALRVSKRDCITVAMHWTGSTPTV